jgi:hypothetical protein
MTHGADHPVHDAIEAIGRAVARVVGAIAERRGELGTADHTAVPSARRADGGEKPSEEAGR